MGAFININNSWKTVTKYFVHAAGSFKAVTDGFININGAWKRFFTGALVPEQRVTISQSMNATTFLITLTGTNYYWSPGPPVLTYYFEWSNNGGTTWSTLSTGNAVNPAVGASTSYTHAVTVNQVTANTLNRYRFRVSGTYGTITGESISTITTIQGPTNITLTAGTPTANTIPINWTTSTGANRYLVEYSSDGGTIYNQYSWVGTTYETLSSLTPGVEYKIRVTPYTGSGATSTYKGYAGNVSNVVTIATVGLAKVTGVSASTPTAYAPVQPWLGAYQTTISWNTVTGAGSYKLEVRAAPVGQAYSAWTHLAWVNHPTNTYLYTGLSNGYSYEIRVSAYTGQASGTAGPVSDVYFFSIQNAAGAFSISSVTKGYPVSSSQGSVRQVSASWGTSSWAYLYQYQIQSSNDGVNWSVANSGTGTPVTFSYFSTTSTSVSISVVNSIYYRFHVRAVSGWNDSATTSPPYASNGLFDATGTNPVTPTSIVVTATIDGASVDWNPGQYTTSSSAGSNIVQGLQYSLNSGSTWITAQTTDPFNIQGLTSGNSYSVIFRAINGDGLVSGATSAFNFTVLYPPPGPVLNLTRQLQALNNVYSDKRFAWSAPTEIPGVAGPVTKYQANINGTAWFDVPGLTSTILDLYNFLTTNTYTVNVRAVGVGGDGQSTSSGPFTIPRITSGPSASNISNNAATISWASANQSTYNVTTSPSTSFYSGTSALSQGLSGLSASTNYTATLQISSSSSDSVSGSVSFSTLGNLGAFSYSISDSTITPGAPNAFSLVFASNQVTYDWNDTANTTVWVSSITGGPEGARSNGRSVSNDFWSATPGNTYTASVYSVNQNRRFTISWGSSTNANSYVVNYTVSGGSQGNGTFNITTTSTSLADFSYGGSVTVNSVTAYSNFNGTGASRSGTLSGSSSVTPTEKYSSTTSASGTYPLPTYTVTWNAYGGTGGGTTTQNAGTAHTAPSPGTRSGYSFNGYYNTPSGDYTYGPIASGGSFTPPSSITMYARWSIVPSGTAPATPTNGGGTYATGTNYTTNATFTRSSSGTTPITYYWSVAASTSSSGPWTPWNSGTISSSTLGGTQSIPQQAWNQSLYGNWARYQVYAQNSVGSSGTLEWLL